MARQQASKKPKPKAKGLPKHLTPGNPGNSGGKPGRSGRKTVDFYERCEGLTDQYVVVEAEAILAKGRIDPDYKWAAEYVSKYSRSAAPIRSEVKHEGEIKHGVVILPAVQGK
jgi:hypothetical protein